MDAPGVKPAKDPVRLVSKDVVARNQRRDWQPQPKATMSAESIKDLQDKVKADVANLKAHPQLPGYVKERKEKRAAKLATLTQ